METISFSLFWLLKADPNLIFKSSACFSKIVHPFLNVIRYYVSTEWITAVCRIIPSLKIATSVVPPRYQRATPASISSLSKTADAEAMGSNVKPVMANCALLTHFFIFFTAAVWPVIM